MTPDALLLIRANALLHSRAEVLADFEVDTIREAHRRCLAGQGELSGAERRVIEDAVAAMLAAPRQDLTDAGLAA